MSRESQFSLSKWYLDCTADNGEVFICYWARVRWRALIVNYSSVLPHCHVSGARPKTSSRPCAPPTLVDGALKWSPPRLSIDATWRALDPPLTRTLLVDSSGEVRWNCKMPRARVEIALDDGKKLRGLGYAEFLEMTVKPWRLPIDELRWGRFVSETDSVVWIDWRGGRPMTVVAHNGIPSECATVTDDEISFDDGRKILRLEEASVLRKGPLVKAVLLKIPGVRGLMPQRMLGTYECKWRSRGTLRDGSRERSAGWVIHEVVRWS